MIKEILKKLLPSSLYNFIRIRPRVMIISESLKRKILNINKSAWLNDPDYRGDNTGALRKYGHMIDKGLQSPSREPGHSLQVASRLDELLVLKATNCDTVTWAEEILELHCKLQKGEIKDSTYSKFPFENDNLITSELLLNFLKERRTLRHFKKDEMPSEKDIKKLLEASIWAPSSCNRQTIVNYFTLDEKLSFNCTKQNKGATSISGKHAFICVCYDTRSYHLPQESLTGIIDATLGFQNSLLMAHALGLGACVLNWSHSSMKENETLRELLSIPDYCEIAFNVIVGIPDGGAPIPGKKNATEYIIER